MNMVTIMQCTVYYSERSGRRYFTKKSAIEAEARHIIKSRYPDERSDFDDFGRCTYKGYSMEFDESERFNRMMRGIKFKINKELRG